MGQVLLVECRRPSEGPRLLRPCLHLFTQPLGLWGEPSLAIAYLLYQLLDSEVPGLEALA